MLLELSTDSHLIQHQVPCRVCGQVGLNPVLSQEREESANASNLANDLAWCPTCTLVQRTESRSSAPNVHISHAGEAEKQSARLMADRLCQTRRLGPDSLVVEIAGSDPDLLQRYHHAGISVLAVESARHTVQIAEQDAYTISETFGPELAMQLARANQRADIIHANDAFANMTDLNGVVAGFATLIKPNGVVVVAVPYLKNHGEFAANHREHVCLFSLTSLTQLFGQHGLEIVDVEWVTNPGEAIRITAARFGTTSVTTAVHDLMDDEAAWVRDPDIYHLFGASIAPSQDRWAA